MRFIYLKVSELDENYVKLAFVSFSGIMYPLLAEALYCKSVKSQNTHRKQFKFSKSVSKLTMSALCFLSYGLDRNIRRAYVYIYAIEYDWRCDSDIIAPHSDFHYL